MIAFGSGVTDPYQPCEGATGIMARCASVLAAFCQKDLSGVNEARPRFPALVMTKSKLVLRDISHWKQINDSIGFVLFVSMASLDEGLQKDMEPGASSFEERLATIRAFKAEDCVVGVLAMPLLPGLSDSVDSIRALYRECADAGVDFIMPGGLTLRPGRQKDFYLRALARYRPDLLEWTKDLYREERASGGVVAWASRELASKVKQIRLDFEMPVLLPHKVFARFIPQHDALRILFRDMIELYMDRGVEVRSLRVGADSYDRWLVGLRRVFRKRRSLPCGWLEGRFEEAVRDGELEKILDNPKLADFCYSILREGKRLDYCSLKLV